MADTTVASLSFGTISGLVQPPVWPPYRLTSEPRHAEHAEIGKNEPRANEPSVPTEIYRLRTYRCSRTILDTLECIRSVASLANCDKLGRDGVAKQTAQSKRMSGHYRVIRVSMVFPMARSGGITRTSPCRACSKQRMRSLRCFVRRDLDDCPLPKPWCFTFAPRCVEPLDSG